ncbi:TPA: KilA-N domain-containing protein [Salmonella enterica subsp. enterica serovar Enteritidis]|uniref:KilA-N domain-containing protein n=1 Tax=Salmonella enterica TaxID=28901 RepID=UPI000314848F|nr:KilA-N domain-containing protein [Salmonella enterica]EKS4789359.1 KilA-N domain-containing protein [Salmonella enterica]EKS4863257.1 KilA-N domain-containing protein [Salmonella enterica]EKS4880551.1 KilA-N domain-containing protein [Salmonella enterica]EKS4885010.1 KilA-N domain-containing protein [Salmonella enterica]EKS5974604.1 KilA-N domain-containing protein [Salmonella enterica]
MTTQLSISTIAIHQDSEGRYSLNDLHKASGNERRHEPRNWLNIQQTKELIDEIINTGISVFAPIESKRGRKGGTYVCKELVYAYAMWISAAFALKVIRAYDAMVTEQQRVPQAEYGEIVITLQNGQPVCSRIAQPGEYMATMEGHTEMLRRAGYVVTHCDDLELLTVADLAKRAGEARQLMNKWLAITNN